jgi:DNA-binding transcriptional MerR regulator
MLQKTQSFYNIQFVARVTGINPHTIRAWEKRYEAVTPLRDDKGRRIYSQQEIDRLELLHQLVSNGNNISDIANYSTEDLEKMFERYAHKLNESAPTYTVTSQEDIIATLRNLKLGLHGFKLDILSHELGKVVGALPPRTLALEVVAPFLADIREMKQNNLLTEEQRDSIFSIIKSALGPAIFKPKKSSKAAPILLAAPAGSLNELGLMISALLCQHYSIDYCFLGGHLGSESVGEIAKQISSQTIILGATFSLFQMSPQKFNEYVDTILEKTGDKSSLWVIGLCTPEFNSNFRNMECVCNYELLDQKLKDFNL